MILKRNISLLGVLFLIAGITACSTSEKIIRKVSVEKVENTASFANYPYVYSLPRTVIDLEFVVEKHVFKPGPFYEYAERFLGIQNAGGREKISYQITGVEISSHAELDPDQVYAIQTEGPVVGNLLNLTEEGILMGVNNPGWKEISKERFEYYLNNDPGKILNYSDVTLSKNIEPTMDTVYRTMRTDTSFIKIPLLEPQLTKKNMIAQAEEAANFIMKLRKRRFYMMSAKYAHMPVDGESMKYVLSRLDKLEADYLSLFTGREMTERVAYSYQYVPVSEDGVESERLSGFSATRGMLIADDPNGDPVGVRLKRVENLSAYSGIHVNPIKSKEILSKGLAYRVPGHAIMEIFVGTDVLSKENIMINQYGKLMYLPSDILENDSISIEFYPERGSIKSIRK